MTNCDEFWAVFFEGEFYVLVAVIADSESYPVWIDGGVGVRTGVCVYLDAKVFIFL